MRTTFIALIMTLATEVVADEKCDDVCQAMKPPFVSRSKEIKIDGVVYSSMREAARSLGISFDALRYKFNKGNL